MPMISMASFLEILVFEFARRQSTASSTARKITSLVFISICLRPAANVVQCVPGSRGTALFPPLTGYPKGLTSLEIDRGLAIGREISSSSNAHSAMPMSPLVERKSGYTVLIKNPSRHSRPIMDKIISAFSPMPPFARQSFTFDRGTEFAGFRALEDGIGARSWFCDPSAPWQKGTVENANKRIRRYLPGTTDLAAISQRDLLQLTRHLNDQPRKCLGYMTPAEAFTAHLQDGA